MSEIENNPTPYTVLTGGDKTLILRPASLIEAILSVNPAVIAATTSIQAATVSIKAMAPIIVATATTVSNLQKVLSTNGNILNKPPH
jgi:hypothetical protein